MKKLTTMIHRFMDIECCEMPDGFEAKCRENQLFTYQDTVLKEHLFSIDSITEKMADEPDFFTNEEIKIIGRIEKLLTKEDCGYFRFVAN